LLLHLLVQLSIIVGSIKLGLLWLKLLLLLRMTAPASPGLESPRVLIIHRYNGAVSE
jgi:hypothetical protein